MKIVFLKSKTILKEITAELAKIKWMMSGKKLEKISLFWNNKKECKWMRWLINGSKRRPHFLKSLCSWVNTETIRFILSVINSLMISNNNLIIKKRFLYKDQKIYQFPVKISWKISKKTYRRNTCRCTLVYTQYCISVYIWTCILWKNRIVNCSEDFWNAKFKKTVWYTNYALDMWLYNCTCLLDLIYYLTLIFLLLSY